jgi:hypothetical protein
MNTAPRTPPSSKEILARQVAEAKRKRDEIAQKHANATPPANNTAIVRAQSTAVASPAVDKADFESYLDEVSPASGFAGRLVKFDHKGGVFSTADNDEPIADGSEYIALCDQVLGGRVKFNGPGEKPEYYLGPVYDGYRPPAREDLSYPELADTDDDPWKWQHLLPLQHKISRDLFTLSVVSRSGNRAVINLLREYDRKQKTAPDKLPVIRLKAIGYQPNVPGVAYQYKPVLIVVGQHDRNDAATPDTSLRGDVDDEIPF